ncbi:hypothetical protein C1H46_021631 [Malus baccata]|uniref:DUF4228 domain-containing protein n=1 Tax=Malus baccata TaxID=106549 RepID=A0A540M1Y2_MALBA|nr:hypothetical protein C1H46_021631 [Malus baccata]
MGNAVSPCFQQKTNSVVKVIFSEGSSTRLLKGKHIAGEIMFEFPDQMVCHADSFFIGRPVPALAINDELILGQTYFVLPIDRFACSVLSASTLAALGSSSRPNKKAAPINFGECPFEYIKGSNGKVLIKVVPEFIARLIARSHKEIDGSSEAISSVNTTFLCSTPELQKHYEQLVVSKEQLWSPKLETISEYKVRFSPCKYIGLEWKEKEQEVI